MPETATKAPLGRVKLLKDIELVNPKNYMKAGEIRDVVPSPVARMSNYTWIAGPMYKVRLLDGEYEMVEAAPSC